MAFFSFHTPSPWMGEGEDEGENPGFRSRVGVLK